MEQNAPSLSEITPTPSQSPDIQPTAEVVDHVPYDQLSDDEQAAARQESVTNDLLSGVDTSRTPYDGLSDVQKAIRRMNSNGHGGGEEPGEEEDEQE